MSIVVAGHTGLVGSAIFEVLKESGEDVIGLNREIVNLLDRGNTFEIINDIKPEVVIDAAAIVGGIGANNSFPVDFLSNNLQIQSNLMDAAHSAHVERFVFLGSSCIYPRECPQPMKEEYLMSGRLEPTNSAYAVAKIAGIELVKAYRRQYNKHWISLMPTNVYGPRDNFNPATAHVLPALVNRFHEVVELGSRRITLWGTGRAKREFIHSTDLAQALLVALQKYDDDLHINVGSGEEVTIRQLATLIASQVGFSGEVIWDSTKPDGTPRKSLDSSRIRAMGWDARIRLADGVRDTMGWYKANLGEVRL